MSSQIEWAGRLIAKNSQAYKLWEERKFKELAVHMKQLDQKEKDLIKHYEQRSN